MKPARANQHRLANLNNPNQDTKYLSYEWSKGYLPTVNPKPDEIDLSEDRSK